MGRYCSEGEVSVWGGIAVRERSVCGEVCSEVSVWGGLQ